MPFTEIAGQKLNAEQTAYLEGLFSGLRNRGLTFGDVLPNPAAAPPDEIRAAVRAAIAGGASDLGKVMGQVMPTFKGQLSEEQIMQLIAYIKSLGGTPGSEGAAAAAAPRS